MRRLLLHLVAFSTYYRIGMTNYHIGPHWATSD